MASVAASEMRRARVASGFAAPSPRLVWHVGLALLVLAVLAGLLGQFASFMLWIEPGRLTFVWIPGGLLMALLMLRSRHEWAVWVVGVTAGGVAALMWRGTPAVFALGAYVPGALGITLAAVYLRRQATGVFSSTASFSRFFAVTTLLLPAAIGWAFSFVADHSGLRPGVLANWKMLAPAYAMGSLLVTMPALACANWRGSIGPIGAGTLATMVEAALIGIALLLLSVGLWAAVPSSESVLPLLTSVQGRQRPLLRLPNGKRKDARPLIVQFPQRTSLQRQIIQRALDHVVIRLVPRRETWQDDLVAEYERVVREYFEAPIRVEVQLFDRLEVPPGGKIRDVLSELT